VQVTASRWLRDQGALARMIGVTGSVYQGVMMPVSQGVTTLETSAVDGLVGLVGRYELGAQPIFDLRPSVTWAGGLRDHAECRHRDLQLPVLAARVEARMHLMNRRISVACPAVAPGLEHRRAGRPTAAIRPAPAGTWRVGLVRDLRPRRAVRRGRARALRRDLRRLRVAARSPALSSSTRTRAASCGPASCCGSGGGRGRPRAYTRRTMSPRPGPRSSCAGARRTTPSASGTSCGRARGARAAPVRAHAGQAERRDRGRCSPTVHAREFAEGVLRALQDRADGRLAELAVGERCGITIRPGWCSRRPATTRCSRASGRAHLLRGGPAVEIRLSHPGRLRDYVYTPEPVARADFFVNCPKFKATRGPP